MKTSFALLAVAGVAFSQSLSDLPACGQTCIGNMIAIATSEFGCSPADINCFCTNQRFGYGVRDCSNEACGADQSAQVIAFGTAYCQNALGEAASSAAGSSGALGVLSSALSTATATGEDASATGDASASGDDASSTPITTSALVGTVTSDGSTYETTTGFSTIYGAVGAGSSAIASATDSAGSAIASATSSAGDAISSAESSASDAASSAASDASSVLESATSAIESATDAANSAASSAASGAPTGAAPMVTAFPLAGAAGIAALLFL